MNNLVQNTSERLAQAVVLLKEQYVEEAFKRLKAHHKELEGSTYHQYLRNIREEYPFIYEEYCFEDGRLILTLKIEFEPSPTHLTYKITPIYYYGN